MEAGTGRGIHHYTIHNYVGRAMNIGKKSPDGKYSVQDLTLINKKASELKDYYRATCKFNPHQVANFSL